jgi:hypothetical protein
VDVDPKVQERLAELQDGYLTTQLLYVAARLGVADAVAGGPRGAEDLAVELGADAEALRRVLRGLAAIGVLAETDGGFGLTAVGLRLRGGIEGSLRTQVLARGGIYFRALDHLLEGVRTGRTAFDLAYGTTFFEYLAARPAERAEFHSSMTERSVYEAKAVVAAFDFGRFTRLVDIGGGHGVLLSAVLAATPGLTGVLFDRPAVVESASVPEGCEIVGGDFFAEVPAGADAYLLSRVIHNWEDADAVRILRNCRKAMGVGATLLLVEAVVPERAADHPAAIRADITMLAMVSGRERTRAEYAALFGEAGLRLEEAIPTGSHAGVWVVTARPIEEYQKMV